MNILNKTFSLVALLGLSFILVSGCKDDEPDETPPPTPIVENGITFSSPGSLTINMNHKFNSQDLQLAPVKYVTAAHDTIVVTELGYRISNIELTTKQGTKVKLGNSNLIQFLPPSISAFTLNNIPAGTYTNISYLIGVDSVRNCSGAQEGDLDPNLGMFWSWNTGYIFVRLIGRHSAAETSYTLDIGGTSNIMSTSHSLTGYAKSGTTATIKLNLDIARIFNTPNLYDLKVDSNNIHNSTSPAIAKLRPNISGAFTLQSVQ